MLSVQPSATSFASARFMEIPERVSAEPNAPVSRWSDVSTLLEVGLMIRDFTGNIGYDKFLACCYVPTPRAESSLFVLNGYPTRWMQIYTERGYVDVDPVLTRQWQSTEPFEWGQLDVQAFHPKAEELFREAMRHGLMSGMSLHALAQSGSHLFLNFASSRHRSLGSQQETVFGAALLLATRVLTAAVDLIERDPNAILRRLSARQLEALQWAAKGLSMREVAIKMGVSPATVEYLMRQAQVNLGAGSREEAILHAAQTGLVSRHVQIRVTKRED